MRGLALVALLTLMPTVAAQGGTPLQVDLSEPVLTSPPLATSGRYPVSTHLEFSLQATVRLPPNAVCFGRILMEFTAAGASGIEVVATPSKAVADAPVPELPGADAKSITYDLRLTAVISETTAAFEPATFVIVANAKPETNVPCTAGPGTIARYVTLVPEFHPAFFLDPLPRTDDEADLQFRLTNLANADARFQVEARSGVWRDLDRSLRLEPASQSDARSSAVVLVPVADLPLGFDGGIRVTQRVADERYGDAPTSSQELDVAYEDVAIPLHAREEAPAPPLWLLLVGLVAVAFRSQARLPP